jgi:hypothetical protein
VSDLLKFKKIADLTKDHQQLADIMTKLGHEYFDVSGLELRRRHPYEWNQVKKETLSASLCSSLVVAVSGFGSFATEEEVKIFLESKCGKLASLYRESGTWNMSFNSFDALLAAMNLNLEYQDSKLKLVCKRYTTSKLNISINNQFTNLYKGVKTSSGLSFTPNRILEFRIQEDGIVMDKSMISMVFEKYALVVTIDFDSGNMGYVRLKKPVANQVVDVINRNGGLYLNEELITVRALQGDEDRVYWELYGSKPITSKVPIIPIRRNGLKRHAGISSHLRKDTSLKTKSASIKKNTKRKRNALSKIKMHHLLDSISKL